jgi:mevalonate kinase
MQAEEDLILKFRIELKFNVSNVNQTPQFISPMNPSKFLSESYENYYYNKYLVKLSKKYNIPIPNFEQYMNEIHSIQPFCMKKFQEKYYNGCKNSRKYTGNKNDVEFYNECKKISKESIENFIEKVELNVEKLSKYLLQSQKNKFYMLIKNNNIYLEIINLLSYEIISFDKNSKKSMFIATTKTGKKMKILLRWKNGNGIAYPAFQIS